MQFPVGNVKPIPINTFSDVNTCGLYNLQEVSSDNYYYDDYHKELTFCLPKKNIFKVKKILFLQEVLIFVEIHFDLCMQRNRNNYIITT